MQTMRPIFLKILHLKKVLFYLVICFRPDNSCWCALSNVDHLCVFSNYKALIIVFCIVSGNSFGTIYRYLMWPCFCLFYGNTSIPLSLCQYLYTSSMAISLSLLNDNISMPLLWQYLYVSSMAISLYLFYGNFSMSPLWQYLYASSMAISLCLFFGNISMPLLWQYLFASSMAISLCLFYGNISLPLLWQYLYASSMAMSICLFFDNTSYFSSMALYRCCYEQYPSASSKYILCFCEQSSGNISASAINVFCFCEQYLFAYASNVSISHCFCEQYYSTTFFCRCQSFYLSVFFLN